MDYKQRKAAFTIGTRLMMDHLAMMAGTSEDETKYLKHIRSHYLSSITEFFTGVWELENMKNGETPTTNPNFTIKQYQEFLADCGATMGEQEICVKSFLDAVEDRQKQRKFEDAIFNGDSLLNIIVANLRRQGPTEKPN